MGQGSMTVDCQHVAEFFKVPMSSIRIRNENSDFMPYDEGTYCSRGTYINGNAIILACKDAKRQILERASTRMGVDKDGLETEGYKIYEKANPEHFIYFHDLYEGGGWAPEGKLVGKGVFMPEQALNNPRNAQGNPVLFYSIGGWGMEVGVNIETGEVKLMQAGGFYDAGRVINRKTCEGQIEGALSMGLGQAVFEEIMINDKGKVINGNYRDYKVPTFMDNPNNEHVKVDFVGEPFATGPNGAKGIGEVAMIPVMAAVANAINAAAGAEIHNIPMTRERVLQALRDKEAADKK
jgi:CO/xanthine dehydrogenase Mo-binding subunit